MTEEHTRTDSRIHNRGLHLHNMEVSDGIPDRGGPSNNTGRSHIYRMDQDDSCSPQKRTFKSVVQRHFVKDKLFVLVNELLKSVDEERQAQEDLIASFQTAREVTGPIRKQSLASAPRRPKRRRKRADTPLLERIEQTRKESKEPLESKNYNKDAAAVGEMKITADEANDTESKHKEKQVTRDKELVKKDLMKPGKLSETVEKNDVTEADNNRSKDVENDKHKSCQRPKSLPANETDKLTAILELNKDENTSELDKLVLDSILHDNDAVLEEGADTKHKDVREETDKDNTTDNDEENTSELTVEVESNTESEEDDATVKVVGTNDEIEDDLDDDFDEEIKKVKDSNESVLNNNRMPASLHPNLDPIAEASSESFQNLPLSSRGSSSIIEIEAKPVAFSGPSYGSIRDCNLPNGTVKTEEHTNKGKYTYHDQSNKNSIRKDIWVIDSEKRRKTERKNKAKEHISTEGERREEATSYGDENSQLSCRESFDAQEDNDKGANKNTKSNPQMKKDTRKQRPKSCIDVTRNSQGETELKNKSKHDKGRRISLDLLDVYEENTDLQRVSKNEIVPSKQKEVTRGKSAPSPRRCRSKSPSKKRTRERRKYDSKPLPPKMISSASLNRRNYNSLTSFKTAESRSRSSSISSFEDVKDSFKNLRTLKDDQRYKRPDSVLWEHLDISEGKVKYAKDGIKWMDDYGYECKTRYSGLTEDNIRNDMGTSGRKVTWNVPLNEAIKNITCAKNVPDISKISRTVPREERVGRLYIDLKQERRAAGFTEYRRLNTAERRDEMDEFSHF